MTKRSQSRYSTCKKLNTAYKNLWGLYSKDYCRSVFVLNKKKTTSYGEVLNIKQSLRLFYSNIKEYSFRYCVQISLASSCITVDKLISIVESRLDSILYRSCLVSSFQEARQIINHGFVKVNGLKTFFCGKKLSKGDIIKLESKLFNKDIFLNIVSSRSLSNHLELNLDNLTIVFLWDVSLINVYYPLCVEYSNIRGFIK